MQNNFSGKHVGVLGLGVEGLSSAIYLLKQKAQVTILDQKDEVSIDKDLLQKAKAIDVRLELGKEAFFNLTKFDILFRSPGIKRLSAIFAAADKKDIPVTSQTKLFFDLCPCPIIGVTGTKGKGTTSTLIFQMLKEQGFDAYLGGNIGTPSLDFLDDLTKNSIVVLELSSFQLQDLSKSPHIAVMLMVTSEHLDYHKDVHEYVDAKRNILRFQTASDFAILNKDYPATNESDIYTDGKLYTISREQGVDEGCFVKDKQVFLCTNGSDRPIIAVEDIQLVGTIVGGHNLENICAAVMAATIAGVKKDSIISVLKSFSGLPHRLEFVREVNSVAYYDDSIATNPESALAGIQSFKEPKILILGGVTEGSDFTELGSYIAQDHTIKAIIGIGKEWPHIKEKISSKAATFILIEGANDMENVVKAASKIATRGDIVLLSPACKSFDMFKNYKDRGNQFKKAVLQLPL